MLPHSGKEIGVHFFTVLAEFIVSDSMERRPLVVVYRVRMLKVSEYDLCP